jgi:hypothetical protein
VIEKWKWMDRVSEKQKPGVRVVVEIENGRTAQPNGKVRQWLVWEGIEREKRTVRINEKGILLWTAIEASV